MERLIAALVVGGLALSHAASAQPQQAAVSSSVANSETAATNAIDIPPLPRGKSTILGGSLRKIDPVRDQFQLQLPGEKPMKILFDERTQYFRDGKRAPLRELAPSEHASVQTTLDGANIFAISIHVLSNSPEGDYQGRVVAYDAGSGALSVLAAPSRQPIRLMVTRNTSIRRQGQETASRPPGGSSDLMPGALISVTFDPGKPGQAMAREITVLATPGSTFIFSGTITELDLPAGRLDLVDPRDEKNYEIRFNAQDSAAQKLRIGQHLRIAANYDGSNYVATSITPE